MGNKRRLKRREKPSDMSMKPTKLEYGVAKYLRFNCPTKTTTYFGNDLHYFNGCKAVDTLLESHWAHGKDDLFLNTRQSCVDYLQGCRFAVLIDKGFFFHARKLVPKKRDPGLSRSSLQDKKQIGDVQKSDGELPSKKARRVKIEFHDDQIFVYVWQYDPTSTKAFLIGILLVIGSILVCLFPLWPQQFRICVYYLSMAVMCFMVRLLLFVIIWICTMGKHHLWLLPNLLEDCSVVESFKPLYAYTYHGKDAEGRKEKNGEDDDEADNDESNDGRDSEDDDDDDFGKGLFTMLCSVQKQSPSELYSTSEDENKEICGKEFSKNREKTELQSDNIDSNAVSPESGAMERKREREFRTKMLRQQLEKEDHERRLKALREAEEREERVRKAKDLQKLKRTLELHCQNEERQRKVFQRRVQLENEKADKRKDAELKTMKSVQKPALTKYRSTAASKYVFGSSTPRSFSYMGKSVAAHLTAEVSGGVNRAGQKGAGLSTKKSVRGVGSGRDTMAVSLYSAPNRESTAHAADSMTKSITIGESSRSVSARNVRQNNSALSTDMKRVAQSGSKAVQRRAVANRTSLNVVPAQTKVESVGISKSSENASTAELLDSTCENILSLTAESVKESDIHEWNLNDHVECDLTKSQSDAGIMEETAQMQEETDENESSLLSATSPSVESRTASVLESSATFPSVESRTASVLESSATFPSVESRTASVLESSATFPSVESRTASVLESSATFPSVESRTASVLESSATFPSVESRTASVLESSATSPSVESRTASLLESSATSPSQHLHLTASLLESVGKTPTDQTRSVGKVNGGNEVSVNVNAKGVKLLTEEEAKAALAEKRRLIREQRNLEILEKMERSNESINKKEPDVEVEEKRLEEKLEDVEKVEDLTPSVEEQRQEVLEKKDTERRPDIKKKINEILTRARMGSKVLETPKSSDGCASSLQEKTPKSEVLCDKNSRSNSLAVLEKLATSGRSIGPSLENILNRVRSPLIYGSNNTMASTLSVSADSGASEQSNCSLSINGDASQFGASVSTKTADGSFVVDGNAINVSYEDVKSASNGCGKSETDQSKVVNNFKQMASDDDSSADLPLTVICKTTNTITTTSSDDVINENANG
ncbi:Translocation protein SEC62 [Trichinella nelsoni]|uniref:Translocation protein SEC62 n=1 Tax=Trichinella nelsoni TaxID=6336 RepID=A0A0V0RKN7_9BILA|nr:Translocation protein SEC62 [Trichinella nelsoni]